VSYRDDVVAAEERAAAAEREVAELRARVPDVDALREDVRSRRAELVGIRGQIDELRRVRLSAPRIWLLLALAFVLALLAVGYVPHWICS
jgi:plasmid replication initiation protein